MQHTIDPELKNTVLGVRIGEDPVGFTPTLWPPNLHKLTVHNPTNLEGRWVF
jgi:hypothetical protein